MSLKIALTAYLSGHSGISALVDDRVYWKRLPRKTNQVLPALVFHIISMVGKQSLEGPSGLDRYRVQINCLADTSMEADEVASAVIQALDGFRGLMGAETILGAHLLNATDGNEDEDSSTLDFAIWHKRTSP